MNNGMLAVVVLGAFAVQWGLLALIRRRKAYQVVYELGPDSHQFKAKTPSFGGLAIALNIWAGVFAMDLFSPRVVWLLLVFSVFALLGFMDDVMSLYKKQNQGLTSLQKFVAQIACSVLLLLGYHYFISPLQLWQLLFFLLVMVGTTNATNLSDGLDGLLAGLSLLTLTGFAALFWLSGGVAYLPVLMVVAIALLAFMSVNWHPARQFMGDTGSLALGALFAGFAIVLGNAWVLLPLGAVYILETLSVIVQVFWYKRTKTRVFLMAPLHHHFELLGLHERAVVRLFWGVQLVFIMFYLYAVGGWR